MSARAVATPEVSFPADTAIGPYLRVKVTSGNLALAGAEDIEVGVTHKRINVTAGTLGASDYGTVLTQTAEGTAYYTASGSITAYAAVYGAASGKVSATENGNYIGIAMEAASDGDVISVLRLPNPKGAEATAVTADKTVTTAESGMTFTTVGATATVTFTLPAATTAAKQKYRFRVGAAQELRLDPDGTETIALPSTGVQGAAGKYLTANADGETVDIECTKDGQWSVFGYTGTWTAEA